MTATGHAILGTLIAAKISNPYLAIPAAIALHILADATPHWDTGTTKQKKGRKRLWIDSIIDVLLGFVVSYLLIYFFFPKTDLSYAFFMVLVSQGLDWVTAPYYFLNMRFPPFSWFYKFQKSFDNCMDKPWGIIIQVIILTIVTATVIFFSYYTLSLSPFSVQKLPQTTNWEIYQNPEAGFSLKYPPHVRLGTQSYDSSLEKSTVLTITATKIDEITDSTLGYTKENALKDEASLEKGNYGEHLDFSVPGSEKVIPFDGSVNAKTFMVLGRFEVCSVTFERIAIFYHDDSQVIINLTGPKEAIIKNSPQYFHQDPANCGNNEIWKDQNVFYEDLINGKAGIKAEDWYRSFDQILSSIKFP